MPLVLKWNKSLTLFYLFFFQYLDPEILTNIGQKMIHLHSLVINTIKKTYNRK